MATRLRNPNQSNGFDGGAHHYEGPERLGAGRPFLCWLGWGSAAILIHSSDKNKPPQSLDWGGLGSITVPTAEQAQSVLVRPLERQLRASLRPQASARRQPSAASALPPSCQEQ